ncbi:uncharacterized protein J4E88_005860 [Alternaria novae-zelandiae]|uniref:uncharacterized protein n=1 Tax=Alternaria novae-zelandiae TaxID=430562 RepID=UPI0020C40B3B|nr:uncharacterized protein J4E88_005860 [Alternaria novae-zelandiae]KAI4679970.1 hypothetical protein J4E88_005860 [Alternaria novae-zelandiae]
MALTKDQTLELHRKATRLLEIKLARVPRRIFASGSRPTIHEYYTKAPTIYVPSIPEQYQLEYLLANYNAVLAADFKAIKTPGVDIDAVKAIWYWQIDKSHSFSRYHTVVRYNILTAVVVGASKDLGAYCPGSAQQFIHAFVLAWKEAVSQSTSFTEREAFLKLWPEGDHDVMRWRSWQLVAMRRAVAQMMEKVPELPFPASEFWDKVQQQPDVEWKKHGHAWAAQWIKHVSEESELAANQKAGDAEMEGVEAGLCGLGMEDAPGYLCEELFEQPHVRALLLDIEEPDPELPKERWDMRAMWMDPSAAIAFMKGVSSTAVDELDTALQNMSFMT